LLHGDESGLLVVPQEIATRMAGQSRQVHEKERELLSFVNGDIFSLDGLRLRMSPKPWRKN